MWRTFAMFIIGGAIGLASPWGVTTWQWWAIIAPICFITGVMYAKAFPTK